MHDKANTNGPSCSVEFCLKLLRYLLETGHAPRDIRGWAENLFLLYRGKFGQSFLKRLVLVDVVVQELTINCLLNCFRTTSVDPEQTVPTGVSTEAV